MREPVPEPAPDIWRTACRQMARRARGGVVIYPALVGFLGLGSDLSRTAPAIFTALLTFVALAAAGRQILIQRFDELFDRSPRLWAAGFFGGLLAACAVIGGILYYIIREHGLVPFTLFALAVAAVLAATAIFIYSHALGVVRVLTLLLALPAIAALAQSQDRFPGPWISWATLVTALYLLWIARQQHRERWDGLAASHQLARRALDLERAQTDLQGAHEELERRFAERSRALEQTSQDYRRIFESAHDAILVFVPDDERVLNVNRRACEVYGFTREEFLRLSLADLSENVERGRQQIRQTLDQGVYYNFESVQRRKDGSRMFLEINASAIEYEGQRAILSINRDVTERRRAEELRLAKETAERAAQTKAQFLANMSHEIRTPMAGIIGLTELLLKTRLDERQGEYAQLVQSSAVSLLRVIDDILDFSKIEAGKLTLEEVPFDLGAVLREVTDLLRLGATAKGTSLELAMADDLPAWVRGDPARLRQVLINLVGNAVKFTDEGTVEVLAERDPKGSVYIRVRDTGIGIPEKAHDRLFELFSQADGSTDRRFGGTGLGLAISRRIVQAMGGEIGFVSTPGRGSTFWILVALQPAAPPPAVEPPAYRSGRRHRILTAEDNPINQLVIIAQLEALGYEVKAVSNGLEAIDALAAPDARPFDLVLMDCQMPRLDGYEAAAQIRRLPGPAAHTPIVALTAHAVQEELDRCLAAGMDDYLTKPFREEALRRKLERWLGDSYAAPDPVAQADEEEPGPDPANPDDALDTVQIESLRELGRETGTQLVRGILAQFGSRPYLDELRDALERGDREAFHCRAHGLKGSSAFLGAKHLSRLFAELERMAHPGTREECLAQIARIETEHGRVLPLLSEALEIDAARKP